jgi:hypothetical protein
VREFLLENLRGRKHLGNVGIDGRIILKQILEEKGRNRWAGFTCSDRFNGRVL